MSLIPHPGTRCGECSCCLANIMVDGGKLALCWACDGGTHAAQTAQTEAFPPAPDAPVPVDNFVPVAAEDHINPSPKTQGDRPMPKQFCKGGCGKELPLKNKSGYAWGHSNGCPTADTTPRTQSAKPEAEELPEAQSEAIEVSLTEAQLDRIWQSLPLTEKGFAISIALSAERE